MRLIRRDKSDGREREGGRQADLGALVSKFVLMEVGGLALLVQL